MLSRLVQWIENMATTTEPCGWGGGVTEWVRAVGPLEFVLHVNGIGSTTALRLLGRELFAYYGDQGSYCYWTPIIYWGWDLYSGYILRLFGRTVWSSPTQEE